MNLADHFAQIMFWILLDENTPTLARIAQQAANYHFKKKAKFAQKKKLQRHSNWTRWNYYQYDLFPTVCQMVRATSTRMASHYSQN